MTQSTLAVLDREVFLGSIEVAPTTKDCHNAPKLLRLSRIEVWSISMSSSSRIRLPIISDSSESTPRSVSEV